MFRKYGIAVIAALALSGAVQANAQQPSIFDFALQHPTEDARIGTPPTIGASVPQGVELHQVDGSDGVYGYFYYEGRPVIVDLGTRSIVRIG